jgi:hypothetical protein
MTNSENTQLPADERCKWHEHQTEGRKVGPDDDPYEGCSHCGRLIETKDCDGCGLTFLDWSAEGFDDVLSRPAVTPGGEVVCVPCSRRAQEEEEREEDEGYDDYDPYEAAGESPFGLPGGDKSL